MENRNNKEFSGFTLIELVVVLTIIALLLAGVTTGTALINQARLQSVIDDVTRFSTAIGAFKLTYNQYPGDYQYAYAQWGNLCDTTAANCNGNGNDRVDENTTDASQNETFRVWQHLNLSKIFTGDFKGIGLRSLPPYVAQLPFSKYLNSVYTFTYFDTYFSKSGNAILIGSSMNGTADVNGYYNASIRVRDAAAIDRKMDDGVANQGNVFSIDGLNVTPGACSAGGLSSALGADYNFSSDDVTCTMIFWYDKFH